MADMNKSATSRVGRCKPLRTKEEGGYVLPPKRARPGGVKSLDLISKCLGDPAEHPWVVFRAGKPNEETLAPVVRAREEGARSVRGAPAGDLKH